MKRSFGFRAMCLGLVLAAAACSDPETAKQEYLANGNKLLAEHKVREAIIEYRNAIRQDSKFGEARLKLAEAYAQASNPEAAFRETMRAADLLPDHTQVQLTAGHYLLLAGRFEDAKTRA